MQCVRQSETYQYLALFVYHCTVMEAEGRGVGLQWEHNCVSRASLYRTVYTSLTGGGHHRLIESLATPLIKTVSTRTTCPVRILHSLWREHTGKGSYSFLDILSQQEKIYESRRSQPGSLKIKREEIFLLC